MADEAGSAVEPNPDLSEARGAGGVSQESESKIQDALDSAFGGLDDGDRKPSESQEASDGGEEFTTVREHKRTRSRRKAPKAEPQQPQQQQRKASQWSDDEEVEREAVEQLEGDEADSVESSTTQQTDASQEGADTDDADGGDDTDDFGGISDRLVNAARRRGWSEDRIQRLIAYDPDLAADTFEQHLEDANALSREFSTLGRAVQQQNGQVPLVQEQQVEDRQQMYGQGQLPPQVQPNPAAAAQALQQTGSGLLPGFQFPKDGLDQFDDGFVQSVLNPIQQHMERIGNVLNTVVSGHDRFIQERQNEVLFQQIDTFFDGMGQDYQDLYGTGSRSDLPTETMEARRRVVKEADAIRTGAMMQGRNLSVQEALEMAHNLVSTPHRDKAARRKITEGLQRRNSQITVKPTNKGGNHDASGGDPIARAEKKLEKRLSKLK